MIIFTTFCVILSGSVAVWSGYRIIQPKVPNNQIITDNVAYHLWEYSDSLVSANSKAILSGSLIAFTFAVYTLLDKPDKALAEVTPSTPPPNGGVEVITTPPLGGGVEVTLVPSSSHSLAITSLESNVVVTRPIEPTYAYLQELAIYTSERFDKIFEKTKGLLRISNDVRSMLTPAQKGHYEQVFLVSDAYRKSWEASDLCKKVRFDWMKQSLETNDIESVGGVARFVELTNKTIDVIYNHYRYVADYFQLLSPNLRLKGTIETVGKFVADYPPVSAKEFLPGQPPLSEEALKLLIDKNAQIVKQVLLQQEAQVVSTVIASIPPPPNVTIAPRSVTFTDCDFVFIIKKSTKLFSTENVCTKTVIDLLTFLSTVSFLITILLLLFWFFNLFSVQKRKTN